MQPLILFVMQVKRRAAIRLVLSHRHYKSRQASFRIRGTNHRLLRCCGFLRSIRAPSEPSSNQHRVPLGSRLRILCRIKRTFSSCRHAIRNLRQRNSGADCQKFPSVHTPLDSCDETRYTITPHPALFNHPTAAVPCGRLNARPHEVISPRMTLPAGTKLGPHEIQSPLGAGGMGEVYRARDTRLQRTVAIKILPAHLSGNSEARSRFEREARTISSLNHPNICTLHDVGAQDNTSYLVMEYVEGETLAERLRKG